MSDPGHRAANGDPEPLHEAGELRRRHEEEVRRERERRSSDGAGDDPKRAAADVEWTPPPEMAGREKRTTLRILLFVLAVAALYFAVSTVSARLFAPKLTLLHAAVPEGGITPGTPVTVGVYARNERMREGAAYALLILEDGTEVEGPVVVVPARDSVLVPVQLSLPAGDHVASFVLYDAWRENVEVSALHGILIRSGLPRVDVVQASLEPAALGDSVLVRLSLSNRAGWAASVHPLVVFTPESGAGQPIEVSLGAVTVPAGQSLDATRGVPAGTVPRGRYLVAVVTVTEAGDRAGAGVHGIPFALPSPERPESR